MDCIFFEVHCNKFKPDPICNLSQDSEKSVSHRVFFFCICKHLLNGLFSQCIYCFVTVFSLFAFLVHLSFVGHFSHLYPLLLYSCSRHDLLLNSSKPDFRDKLHNHSKHHIHIRMVCNNLLLLPVFCMVISVFFRHQLLFCISKGSCSLHRLRHSAFQDNVLQVCHTAHQKQRCHVYISWIDGHVEDISFLVASGLCCICKAFFVFAFMNTQHSGSVVDSLTILSFGGLVSSNSFLPCSSRSSLIFSISFSIVSAVNLFLKL